MFESEIDRLVSLAERELTGLSAKQRDETWQQINSVFKQWKQDHGEAPKGGLFGTVNNPDGFESAEPWQCAGYGIRNQIDLAFKLWIDNYPQFVALVESKGMRLSTVFALCVVRATPQTSIGSIIRAVAFIVESRIDALELINRQFYGEIKKFAPMRRKQIEALATGRPEGTESNRRQANERWTTAKQVAVDFAAHKLALGRQPSKQEIINFVIQTVPKGEDKYYTYLTVDGNLSIPQILKEAHKKAAEYQRTLSN